MAFVILWAIYFEIRQLFNFDLISPVCDLLRKLNFDGIQQQTGKMQKCAMENRPILIELMKIGKFIKINLFTRPQFKLILKIVAAEKGFWPYEANEIDSTPKKKKMTKSSTGKKGKG